MEIGYNKELLRLPFEIEKPEEKWIEKVKERINKYVEKLGPPHLMQDLNIVKEGIIAALDKLDKDEDGVYRVLEKMLKEINFGNRLYKKEITQSMDLYRTRANIPNDRAKDEKDFYHRPFDIKNENTGRFNSKDFQGWYLGESKEVTKIEIKDKSKFNTCKVNLKDGKKLEVADLTSEELYSEKWNKDSSDFAMIIFPLVLACYCCVKRDENSTQNETRSSQDKDKQSHEERNKMYVIPQCLAKYIRNNAEQMGVCGIRYFTVRNEDLNPNENTYKNICLFTDDKNAEPVCINEDKHMYDMKLMKMFDFDTNVENYNPTA